MKKLLVRLIKRIPGAYFLAEVVRLFYELAKHRSLRTILYAPPGHFYSPLPNLRNLREQPFAGTAPPETLDGIELRRDEQLQMLETFAKFRDELPFPQHPQGNARYWYDNAYFGTGDAVILYSMIRVFQPSRIVEVGSGYSSAAMLDTLEALSRQDTRLTFIEPYPNRLLGLLTDVDRKRCTLIQSPVQGVPSNVFAELHKHDILFIDSSHTSKTGSDVNYLLFEQLPILRPGVIIHFHDIIWPFEYPREWTLQRIAWKEAYLLRAFLTCNDQYEILYFNSYIGVRHPAKLAETLPLCSKTFGGRLWLRKKALGQPRSITNS